jgi:hypothetical protein
VTTWLGTVPHFMYFQWLYRRPSAWTLARLAPAAIAVVMAIAGIVFGAYSLYPGRKRGDWHVSAFRGVSKWHHISGVVFGVLVLIWTLSGILEELGGSNKARSGQAERSRGGAVAWSDIALRESDAAARVRSQSGAASTPVAIDLAQVAGRPGYVFHLLNGNELWVDAATGAVRGELPVADVREAALRIMGDGAPVSAVDRIAKYDTYYYAHHGHEMHLPAWRVAFADGAHSTVYLETVSGAPVGFVDDNSRTWRWIRDAAHTIDIAALNDHRPLRDLVLLPLLLGGTVSAATGVWLLLRRVRRMAL